MVNKEIEKIVTTLRDKLRVYDNFLGVYLYGSQVTGQSHKDSDIDVAAVFTENVDNVDSISGIVLDIDLMFDVVLDFQRTSQEYLKLDKHYFNELKKGVYYAR